MQFSVLMNDIALSSTKTADESLANSGRGFNC